MLCRELREAGAGSRNVQRAPHARTSSRRSTYGYAPSPGAPLAERIEWYTRLAESGCVEWTGGLRDGYGRLRVDGVMKRAHRVMYEMAHGEIPDDLEIDHICRNRACVNIEHLRAVSKSTNQHNRGGANVNSTTGVRGVHRKGNKFSAKTKINGREVWIGTFSTVEQARAALSAALSTNHNEQEQGNG